MNRECRVEQVILTFDINQFDDIFFCDIVYFTAAISGVDESTQTNFCESTGFMSSDISEQVAQSTLRYVVSFHFVFQSHFYQSGNCCPVTCDISFQHAFMSIVFSATTVFVTLRTAVYICQVVGFACFQESFFNCFVQCFRNSTCNETAGSNGVTIFYKFSCFISSNNFNFSHR